MEIPKFHADLLRLNWVTNRLHIMYDYFPKIKVGDIQN